MTPPLKKFVMRQTDERLKKLAKALRGVKRDSADPETIHDLRVAIRRLEECLRVFKGALSGVGRKNIKRSLKEPMERCGEVRNRDIALKLIRELNALDAALEKALKAERDRQERKLRKSLRKLRGRVNHWRDDVRVHEHGCSRLQDSLTPEANATRILLEMSGEFFEAGTQASRPNAGYDAIHQFRLAGKSFRYTLEIFEPVLPRLRTCINSLRSLQDKLGDLHDAVVTSELIGKNRRAGVLIRKVMKRREGAFQEFWTQHFDDRARLRWEAIFKGEPARKNDGNLHPTARGSRTTRSGHRGPRSQTDGQGQEGRQSGS